MEHKWATGLWASLILPIGEQATSIAMTGAAILVCLLTFNCIQSGFFSRELCVRLKITSLSLIAFWMRLPLT